MSKHKTLSYIVEGVGGWYIKDIEKILLKSEKKSQNLKLFFYKSCYLYLKLINYLHLLTKS